MCLCVAFVSSFPICCVNGTVLSMWCLTHVFVCSFALSSSSSIHGRPCHQLGPAVCTRRCLSTQHETKSFNSQVITEGLLGFYRGERTDASLQTATETWSFQPVQSPDMCHSFVSYKIRERKVKITVDRHTNTHMESKYFNGHT